MRALPACAALLLYLAFGASLLWPALTGDQVLSASASFVRDGPFPGELRRQAPEGLDFFSDAVCCFDPWLRFAADAFAADGRIPLWKPTAAGGAPFVGNGQSALFFPTNLLALLLGAPPVVHALAVLAKLVAGAFGAWLLGRYLGLSFAAALLCGLCFGFGGFQAGFQLHPLTNVSLLLPLLVLAVDRLALKPSFRRAVPVAAVAALQHLGGHPETIFHCQVAVVALGGARALGLRREIGRGAAWGRLLWIVAALGLGAALAAIQLAPVLEYLLNSAALHARRQELPLQAVEHPLAAAGFGAGLLVALWALRRLATSDRGLGLSALLLFAATLGGVFAGLHAGLVPTFVLQLSPDWFGGPRDYLGPAVYIGESSAFVGAALPLAVLGLLQGRPRGPVLVAGATALLGVLETYTAPLVDDALRLLPVFGLAFNARLGLLGLLALAVLAGYGLDTLGRVALREKPRRRLVLAVLGPALGGVVALACAVRAGVVSSGNFPGVPTGVEYVEARLLAAEKVAPLFAEQVEGTTSAPAKVFHGLVLPTSPHDEVRVVYGRDGASAETLWKPAPVKTRRSLGAGAGVEVFRASVPSSRLSPEPTRVRVQLLQSGRLVAVSGLLTYHDDDGGTWLPFPARPAPGTTTRHLLLLVAALGLALLAPVAGGVRLGLRAGLLVLVATGLWTFNSGLVALLPEPLFYPASPTLDVLRGARPDGRMFTTQDKRLPPEVPTYYGIADVRGYDGLLPVRVARFTDSALGRPAVPGSSPEILAPGEPDFELLGLMAARFILYAPPSVAGFARVGKPLPVTVAENPHFVSRARLVGFVEVEPDDERALARLKDPDFDRLGHVVLAELADGAADAAGASGPTAVAGGLGAARITVDRPDRVAVEIEPRARGWLVLADTFFPGWVARVDGQPREILRANVAFRAVPVAPGDHLVEFRYEPFSVRAGAIVSLLALGLAIGAWLFGARRTAGVRAT